MTITAEDLIRRGAERHRAGDLDGAESHYRRALRLAPHHPDALNLLGVAARMRGDLDTALELAAKAVAQAPDSPVFLANQGAALAEAGQLGPALAVLERTLRLRPDDVVSLRNFGQALTAAGRPADALPALREAARLAPAPEVLLSLAHAAKEAGATEEARAAAARVTGPLAGHARFLLAALDGEAPDRAPAAYVRDLFDAFAPRFDAELTGALAYRTPALLAALLGPGPFARLLDLGCGTGLSGAALRPLAARLEGLDLSPRMLARARATGHYDALHEGDLLEFLPRRAAAFDAVAAADVLNYLGDLAPAFAAIRAALKGGGVAAWSLEKGEAPVALHGGLRFRHAPAHAAALAEAAGLRVTAQQEAALRTEKGEEVAGVLMRAEAA
ncbi:methyltransferase domain-containing protein [Roseococcus sp. DSY-14]|uniref:methyltransferase domain-containing protein n=1 Tax=Roseococcus sp. DSY-14 TaxID=3369650 RepID=UPI00387B1C6F